MITKTDLQRSMDHFNRHYKHFKLSAKWLGIFGMLFLQMGLSQSCNGPLNDDHNDVAAIKAMSAARAKAFNDGDAGAIAIHFTEQGVLMAPGSDATFGRAAVEKYYQSIFDQYATELESGYEEVKVSGDLAFGRG